MKDLSKTCNTWGDDKVIDACCLFGMMDTTGRRFSGRDITRAIGNMHDRGNGLGGGFAVYGIYPEYEDYYALHVMYLGGSSKTETESFLNERFLVAYDEEVPTFPLPTIHHPPLVWRYFVHLREQPIDQSADDYVVEQVMTVNTVIPNAFIFSSGKNMGVFKGVGYPEEIAAYFGLENYEGYLWTAHGRFPTNTQGWWGGAHPFNILDWTVVHNGEISSYGINRRFLEMYGYQCTMHTDTEVIAYAVDLLMRKHKLPMEITAKVLSAPLWTEIERMSPKERQLVSALRQSYGSLLMNGPFTIIIAHQGEIIGLTDRIRLRPLSAGTKGSMLYLSSEESAIRLICRDLDETWTPLGGEPVIGRLGSVAGSNGRQHPVGSEVYTS
ncbi:MAG: hypothetical protein EPO21_10905 [Chloroflexota bacterium]|nr:MAG: hypothetical protein EPO21_10905 [Chloroflexota bacterium]